MKLVFSKHPSPPPEALGGRAENIADIVCHTPDTVGLRKILLEQRDLKVRDILVQHAHAHESETQRYPA